MQHYLLYQANTPDEINECSYSLLRYLTVYNVKPPKDHSVVIYTSQPALLENYSSFFYNFELRDVQPTNSSRFELLQNFFKEHDGNVLFLQTNTYCINQIDRVFQDIAKGTVYVLEWNPVPARRSQPAGKLRTIQVGADVFTFSADELDKWNDSVLGMRSSYRELVSEIRSEAEAATELPQALAEKWIFHHKLQKLNVRTAEEVIAQYNDLKEFRELLRKFFSKYQEESVPNQLKLIHHLDAALIQKQKKEFQKLPLHQKLYRRITGKHWSIEKYKV